MLTLEMAKVHKDKSELSADLKRILTQLQDVDNDFRNKVYFKAIEAARTGVYDFSI